MMTAAPAPSPNSTSVARSSGSMMRLKRLGADDQHVLVADADHRRADDELVDEARARGREVERSAANAERFTDERAGVGERLFG